MRGAWAGIGVILVATPVAAVAGQRLALTADYPPGSIVISQSERTLYLVLDGGTAIAYPVAVAKRGLEWGGWARVAAKYVEPAWSPPDAVRRDHPRLPEVIPGGAPNNPMGARALALDRPEIAIHGTTRAMRASIGTAASYGCIRMRNEDVIDLYDRVRVGAQVMMTP
jgi:lipoprotein-anchoring transpeptidase ErfK/SrfK